MLGVLLATQAQAQDRGFHWAYATWFGTGRYELDGYTETTVVNIPPGWTWREPSLDQSGRRTIGYRFRFPVSIGATEFASIDRIDDLRLDSISAISVVPGVEVEIPLSNRWRLKPMGFLGAGLETGGGDDASIFRFALRSQLAFDLGDTRMLLVNGVERIGFSADEGASSAMNLVQTGLDFSRPLENHRIGQQPVTLSWHLMYTRFLDSLGLDLRQASLRPKTLGSEWELGVAFGKQDAALALWRLKFDRVGVAYRFNADGGFSGVGIVFRSLFDR